MELLESGQRGLDEPALAPLPLQRGDQPLGRAECVAQPCFQLLGFGQRIADRLVVAVLRTVCAAVLVAVAALVASSVVLARWAGSVFSAHTGAPGGVMS